tara:strand:+ start:8059 stop:8562 length:504 start_codon:yes stop_codon:yes gene_type:complete
MKKPQQFNSSELFPLLDDARTWLPEAAESREGAICPCCFEFNKVYHRTIPVNTVKSLFKLHQLNSQEARAYHSREFTESHSGGDFAKIAALGLFSKVKNLSTKKKESGYWYITESGKEFCRGDSLIQEKLIIYHNQLIGTEGTFKSIRDFWPEFDYSELMINGRTIE